jgi:hypothetical protein
MGRKPKFDVPVTDAERKARSRALDPIEMQANLPMQIMDKNERHDLLVVMRQREKVALAEAEAFKATLLAQFEQKVAAIYLPSDHPVWAQAHEKARRAGEEAQATIRATLKELGIPERWAPRLSVDWEGRGENASKRRREELRRVATTEAERRCKDAIAKIRAASVSAQERVVASGLSSEAARAMLDALPTVTELVPALELEGIERLAAQERDERERPRWLSDFIDHDDA